MMETFQSPANNSYLPLREKCEENPVSISLSQQLQQIVYINCSPRSTINQKTERRWRAATAVEWWMKLAAVVAICWSIHTLARNWRSPSIGWNIYLVTEWVQFEFNLDQFSFTTYADRRSGIWIVRSFGGYFSYYFLNTFFEIFFYDSNQSVETIRWLNSTFLH